MAPKAKAKAKAKAAPADPVFSEDSASENGEDSGDISLNDPPTSIDPYSVLSVPSTATADEIKTAYRKLALKHHPDKVTPSERDSAHQKFQEIAFAYAILSDERRRKRYDATGNTAESANVDDADFNWTEFFRDMSAQVVSGQLIDQIKREYQGTEEERLDVLAAYEDSEGDLDAVFESVMCSEVLDDEERFRKIIDQAIAQGEVEGYVKYTKEAKKTREKRRARAKDEEKEAMQLAEELGVRDKLFGKGDGSKADAGKKSTKTKSKGDTDTDTDGLMALIQQRQKSRAQNFFDDLEAKYGGEPAKRGAGKRKVVDEPPDEAFLKNAKKGKKGGKA
ncbi:uncharacterized protein A1O9_09970 [Exophiala aquamarina CBS 119918]|uniref:J domain-containing protein n=1 Tax=Exophiala aquamarina CBS 119918 TaxID=1182545 RepID=A0A072PF26_9EURO|nr:uncharacterized protein A1O9_09970 [Exophiala aquamarina CBS 119918]KEF54175.1 hypothetical protein A1O9_09970 [Exophiala aquamarina CBS 119918]